MIIVPEYNVITKDDDITTITAKLNATAKTILNVTVKDLINFIDATEDTIGAPIDIKCSVYDNRIITIEESVEDLNVHIDGIVTRVDKMSVRREKV